MNTVKEKETGYTSLAAPIPRGFKLFLALSLLFHFGVVIGAVAFSSRSKATPIIKEKPIVAKLVRLGEKKPPGQLPRIPTSPPPEEKTINLAGKEEKKETKKEETAGVRKEQSREKDLWAALNKVEQQYKRSGRPEVPEGDPYGSPYGTASEAREGDRYLMAIEQKVRGAWEIPSIIPERERLYLKATVVMYIDAQGKLLKVEMETASGNRYFDNSLVTAIKQASPFPPPPAGFAAKYQKEGIGVNFRAIQ
ncbi:MAG: hypothetical protein Kow0090_09340 [Myxococcota bacterium]